MADGVVVVVDADTTRYAAGIQKAAEATKSLVKPVKEHNELWEAGVELLGRNIMKMTAIGAAVGIVKAGAEAVIEVYDNWIARLDQAKKTMEEIEKSSKGPLGGQLGGPGADRSALLGMSNQLNNDQRFSAYNAFRQSNPGSTSDQRKAAVEAAADADKAGLDPTQFAGNLGKLRGLGDKAKDITAMAMSRGGEQGGAIVDLLQKMTAGHGAAQAEAALPMLMSAANVPGGVASVAQGYSAFASQGRQGSFADTYKNFGQSLLHNIDEQPTIKAVNAGTKPVQTMGQFEAMVGSGEGDPLNAARFSQQRRAQDKENYNLRENAADSLRKDAKEDFRKTYNIENPWGSSQLGYQLEKTHYYDNDKNPQIAEAAKYANEQRALADKLDEQNKIIRDQKSPSNGARNEGAN